MNQTQQDQEKELQDRLIYIFGNVNEWLKFAEAKNAGLFAFTGAAIFGLLSFKVSSANLYDAWKAGINISILFLLAAATVSLFSFFPQTARARAKSSRQRGLRRFIPRTRALLKNKKYRSDRNNLLFYVELGRYNARRLICAVGRKYVGCEQDIALVSKFHHDLANQIVINSRICTGKNYLFKIALGLTFGSLIGLLMTTLIYASLGF